MPLTRSDTPHILYGAQQDYKRLYYSEELAALKVPITLQAGYGILEMGTALSLNASAASSRAGKALPYNPTSFTGAETHPGRAYLVANSGTTDNFVYVNMDDSYKFAVGDDLIINDNTTSVEDLGVITAIDRTTETHRAKITATTNIGGAAFTTARKAYVNVQAASGSSNNYSDGIGILEKSVDTGTGQYAQGAVATLILGNAVLYTGMLTNVDSAFRTDISASTFGNYTYIR